MDAADLERGSTRTFRVGGSVELAFSADRLVVSRQLATGWRVTTIRASSCDVARGRSRRRRPERYAADGAPSAVAGSACGASSAGSGRSWRRIQIVALASAMSSQK